MKNALAVLAAFCLAAAVSAQTPPQGAAPSGDSVKAAAGPDLGEAAAGEVIYFRYCASCHGRSLKGDGPVASGLVKKPIDLTVLAKKNNGVFPFDKVAGMIDGRQTNLMHVTPDMPVWRVIFSLTQGTDAPTADLAVKRITHFVWANQAKEPAKK